MSWRVTYFQQAFQASSFFISVLSRGRHELFVYIWDEMARELLFVDGGGILRLGGATNIFLLYARFDQTICSSDKYHVNYIADVSTKYCRIPRRNIMYCDKSSKMLIGFNASLLSILTFCLILIMLPQNVRAQFEKPHTLKAQSFLPPEILKGSHHTISDQVDNDGVLNHYSVNSSFGNFKVISTSSLHILVREIDAIAEMKMIETDDTAIEALKTSGKNTVTGVKNLVNDPKGTFESAAAGVSGLFNRAKGTVGKRELTSAEDSKMEQLIGFSKAKGQIATRFGVNMYSRNEALQEELDRLAWADYLGGLSVGMATSAVPGIGGVVLATSGTARLLNEAINSTPASELWLQNKNKLLKMGMNGDTVELFLNNPQFSPALQTVLVTALDSMKNVNNLELYIKIALQAGDPDIAKIVTESAVMTAGYHKHIAPIKNIAPIARLARAEKKDGTIVVVLPNDYLIWSERVADFAGSLAAEIKVSGGAGLEIWFAGGVSSLAESKLSQMGWKVHTKVRGQLMPIKK